MPPGTSKWNRVEHRLFAFIAQNWRGKPLLTRQVIGQLIAITPTSSGFSAPVPARRKQLRNRDQGLRRRNGRAQHHAGRLPRRVAPHHRTAAIR
jgi:hypothetical protein